LPKSKQLLRFSSTFHLTTTFTFVLVLIDDGLLSLLLSLIIGLSLVHSFIEPPPPAPGISLASFHYNITSTTHKATAMADSWAAPATTDAWGSGGGDAAARGDSWGSAPAPTADAGAEPVGIVEDPEAKAKKEEFLKKARDAGWTEATAFDYTEFLRTGGEASISYLTSLMWVVRLTISS
jgi:hypothetical protein